MASVSGQAGLTSIALPFHFKFMVNAPMQISNIFTILARFEAATWLGLLIGMYLKYGLEATELGVWLFGRLHGAAFLLYLFAAIITSVRLRWPWWCVILAVLAAIPPLLTLPLELWLRKRGFLDHVPSQSK